MRVEVKNGIYYLTGYILPSKHVKKGQQWINSAGNVVTIIERKLDYVTYKSDNQHPFSKLVLPFQCKYNLVLPDNNLPKF